MPAVVRKEGGREDQSMKEEIKDLLIFYYPKLSQGNRGFLFSFKRFVWWKTRQEVMLLLRSAYIWSRQFITTISSINAQIQSNILQFNLHPAHHVPECLPSSLDASKQIHYFCLNDQTAFSTGTALPPAAASNCLEGRAYLEYFR